MNQDKMIKMLATKERNYLLPLHQQFSASAMKNRLMGNDKQADLYEQAAVAAKEKK